MDTRSNLTAALLALAILLPAAGHASASPEEPILDDAALEILLPKDLPGPEPETHRGIFVHRGTIVGIVAAALLIAIAEGVGVGADEKRTRTAVRR